MHCFCRACSSYSSAGWSLPWLNIQHFWCVQSSLSSSHSWFLAPTKWKSSLVCVLGSWIFSFLEFSLLLFESLVCLSLAVVIRVWMSQSWMDSCKPCSVQMMKWGIEESDKVTEDSLAELGTELCLSHEAILLTASRNKFLIFIVTFSKFSWMLLGFELNSEVYVSFFWQQWWFWGQVCSLGLFHNRADTDRCPKRPGEGRDPGIGMSSSQNGNGAYARAATDRNAVILSTYAVTGSSLLFLLKLFKNLCKTNFCFLNFETS